MLLHSVTNNSNNVCRYRVISVSRWEDVTGNALISDILACRQGIYSKYIYSERHAIKRVFGITIFLARLFSEKTRGIAI